MTDQKPETDPKPEQDTAANARRRRIWRILVMFATMGYVFPHALID